MPSSASIRMPSASGVGNGFFLQAVTTSTARPHPASASPPRIGNPARHERCRQEGRSRQTRQAAMTDGLPSSVDVLPRTLHLGGQPRLSSSYVRDADYTSGSLKEDRVAMTFAIHLQSATVQLIFRRALDRDEQDRVDRCFLGFKLQSKLFEDIEHGWCRWIGKTQFLGGAGSAIGPRWR